jgi:hypothetical protein
VAGWGERKGRGEEGGEGRGEGRGGGRGGEGRVRAAVGEVDRYNRCMRERIKR